MKKDKARAKKGLCAICGRHGVTHIHHVYGGAHRGFSERCGLVIEVCPECHQRLHDSPGCDRALKHDVQKDWEKDHSHEEWMKLAHKSWL